MEVKDNLLHLVVNEKDELILEGIRLKACEKYEIIKNSTMPRGTAELEIKILVNVSDSTQEQILSQGQKGLGEK